MIQWAKRFFTDETAFVGAVRAILMGVGGMAATGQLEFLPAWAGAVAMAAGGFIRAGDRNQ